MSDPILQIELVPETCWYSNVRSEIPASDWELIKKFVSKRAGRKCEICGGIGPKWPVEAHERWAYDDINHVQTLEKIVALCPSCHQVKHFGFAQVQGKEKEALAHLMKVNNWSATQAHQHIEQAISTWRTRSQHQWKLDISGLEAGLKLIKEGLVP
jgi:hypothetical protein